MNRDQFRDALHKEFGRAILFARDNDASEFRDLILDACLNCYAFDVQIEGARGSFMHELTGYLPDRDFYRAEVLRSLRHCGDDNHARQRFHFAACMADDGSEPAKRAMYDNYRPGPQSGEAIGIEFVEMDGIPGMLFAVEKLGALLNDGTKQVDMGWLISHSHEVLGEVEVSEALQLAAVDSPNIAIYIGAMNRPTAGSDSPTNSEVRSWTYSQLLQRADRHPVNRWMSWGRTADDGHLLSAARGLIAANGDDDVAAHLRIFWRREFPLEPEVLLNFTESENEKVRRGALIALRNVSDSGVRDLALRLITTRAEQRGFAIDILNKNFHPGDHVFVLEWFRSEEQPEILHSIGLGLEDFRKAHPDDAIIIPTLLALYERGPCSSCREGAVRKLILAGSLPEEIAAECAFDSNSDIRELVAGGGTPPAELTVD